MFHKFHHLTHFEVLNSDVLDERDYIHIIRNATQLETLIIDNYFPDERSALYAVAFLRKTDTMKNTNNIIE